MDERFVKKLLVPSFVIVILSTLFVYEFKYLIDVLFFKKKHLLIIGILSAPENFEQRTSVRETWLQLISEISGSSYFIIGNEICEVPPIDRPDPYSCLDMPFVLPQNVSANAEFTTVKIWKKKSVVRSEVTGYVGFGFYVRSRISIVKLGILKEAVTTLKSEIKVKLISAFNKKILASVTFIPRLVSESDSTILTRAIRPVTLVKDYEAFVVMETKEHFHSLFPSCKNTIWETGPKVINFINLWQEDSVVPLPFTNKSCSYVYMTYNILDSENVKNYANNRTARLKEWQQISKKISNKLKNESETHHDLMFLDVVDVYRNLSLKMVKFYKRIIDTEYFHYVLKTDDDSFVDLLRVHSQLKLVNKEIDEEISQTVGQNKEIGIVAKLRLSKFWWWSFFKEFWRVQHSGKWRENRYQSASYPTFPCGGGYIVNKGIVDYITSNEINLQNFQGEDVSLGIWLSSLPVIQYKVPKVLPQNGSQHIQRNVISRFQGKRSWSQFKTEAKAEDFAPDSCDWTCDNNRLLAMPLCNKVQLSISDMYDTWTEYINKGFL